jgi:hypothetical protein
LVQHRNRNWRTSPLLGHDGSLGHKVYRKPTHTSL